MRESSLWWRGVFLSCVLMCSSCNDEVPPVSEAPPPGGCPAYDSVNTCNNTCVGLTPINDLGSGFYMGLQGGLYPGGSNTRPETHDNAGIAIAEAIQPLGPDGNVDLIAGKIVLISIGMSNAMQEFEYFQLAVDTLQARHPSLVVLNGAQGGKDIDKMLDTADPFWDVIADTLAEAGLTHAQVQVIWFKQAEAHPVVVPTFPGYADDLKNRFADAMRLLKDVFPNSKLCYLASRIYGNYGTTPLNLEPYGYYQGWAVKRLIEDQIDGDPGLAYTGSDPSSPWLSWGTYIWADGLNPRSDGLTWICPDDYDRDGNHPSITGRIKVAQLLLDYLLSDPSATPWLLNNN